MRMVRSVVETLLLITFERCYKCKWNLYALNIPSDDVIIIEIHPCV